MVNMINTGSYEILVGLSLCNRYQKFVSYLHITTTFHGVGRESQVLTYGELQLVLDQSHSSTWTLQ